MKQFLFLLVILPSLVISAASRPSHPLSSKEVAITPATLLLSALTRNNEEEVTQLLTTYSPEDLTKDFSDEQSPYARAYKTGNPKLVTLLHQNGIPESEDPEIRKTSLNRLILSGKTALLEIGFACGVIIPSTIDETILSYAQQRCKNHKNKESQRMVQRLQEIKESSQNVRKRSCLFTYELSKKR